jgi:hypothetical protein
VHGAALLRGAGPAGRDAAGPAHSGGAAAEPHVVVGAELARLVLVDAPDRHAAAPDGDSHAGRTLAGAAGGGLLAPRHGADERVDVVLVAARAGAERGRGLHPGREPAAPAHGARVHRRHQPRARRHAPHVRVARARQCAHRRAQPPAQLAAAALALLLLHLSLFLSIFLSRAEAATAKKNRSSSGSRLVFVRTLARRLA